MDTNSSLVITDIKELEVPDNFSFATNRLVTINIHYGEAASGINVEILGLDGELRESFGSGVIREDGMLSLQLYIPDRITELECNPWFIGLPDHVILPISRDNTVVSDLTVREPVDQTPVVLPEASEQAKGLTNEIDFTYVTPYNKSGTPLGMGSIPVTQELLNNINASLPEYYPVPRHNPEYIEDGKDASIFIQEKAEVSVTFLHEGAGYKNSLGFYTYTSAEDLLDSHINIVIPNASLSGSGGEMRPGDTIDLGVFEPGQTIGWVLFANGWSTSSLRVRPNQGIYYSDAILNPEVEADKKPHTVVLYDTEAELFIVSFEDLNRTSGGDNDFNDLVFMVTVTPFTAVGNIDHFTKLKEAVDSDDDGVIDADDDYPDNPELASKTMYYGTVAFEDMWPSMGDYDFNDVVVEYSYELRSSAKGYVREIGYAFTVKASGAGFQNSLRWGMPLEKSQVVHFSKANSRLGGDAVEASDEIIPGNSCIVFPVTDSVRRELGNKELVNTKIGGNQYSPTTISGTVALVDGIEAVELGAVPFDIYILRDSDGTNEIHMPDYPPTGAESSGEDIPLGKGDDRSNSEAGSFYKTEKNLPWALHVPVQWSYPVERAQIVQAYNHFAEWAISGGTRYVDWYLAQGGYVEEESLYK